MIFAALLLILCMLSFYFSTMGFLCFAAGMTGGMAVPFALLVSGWFVSYLLRDKGALRFLPLFLVAGCFAYVRNVADAVFLVPVCGFVIFAVAKNFYGPDYRKLINIYFRCFIAVVIGTVLSILLPESDTEKWLILIYSLIFMLSGVLSCRILRQADGTLRQWKFRAVNIAMMVVLCVVALFLSSRVFLGSCAWLVYMAYNYIIIPIALAFSYVLFFFRTYIMMFVNWVMIRRQGREQYSFYELMNDYKAYSNDMGETVLEPLTLTEISRYSAVAWE